MAKKGGAEINPLDGPPDLDLRDITPAEETELERVFHTLADLHERTRLETHLQVKPSDSTTTIPPPAPIFCGKGVVYKRNIPENLMGSNNLMFLQKR